MSRATIYRYFDNRDELVLAVVLRSLDRSGDGDLDDFFAGADTPERFGDGRWSTPWSTCSTGSATTPSSRCC